MSFDTPILLLTYNRPRLTVAVLDRIRSVKASRIFWASDGPLQDCCEDQLRVQATRDLINLIDWPCEVSTLFQDTNLGCKDGVLTALDWFFAEVEMGIVLEDDCVPHLDFFYYCSELLKWYKDCDQVKAICSNNFQAKNRVHEFSYYFSRYFHSWGWASWRRAWVQNDPCLNFWPKWKRSYRWLLFFGVDLVQVLHWTKIFDISYGGRIDTWDFSWIANIWYHNGVVITPVSNLVSNHGFGPEATHTKFENHVSARLSVSSLLPINHPKKISVNVEADRYTFNSHFNGSEKRGLKLVTKAFRRILNRPTAK